MIMMKDENNPVNKICNILGLKNCKNFSIHFPEDDVVNVTAEFLPTKKQIFRIFTIIKRYELVEKKK